jgi:uncharacterized protein YndB with AHSA1/START domain
MMVYNKPISKNEIRNSIIINEKFLKLTMEKIIVTANVMASKTTTWDAYTNPVHITQWNFADPSWHCPHAENDLRVGGKYLARMEAKDGSFGFDLEAVYSQLDFGNSFHFGMDDRQVIVKFEEISDNETFVSVSFDPETENPLELQQQGWQAILNNFKTYTETL